MRSIRIALAVVLAGLVAAPAYADDPVVNYVRVSVDSDQKLGCNDLNVEIGNVNRDIGLLESQDEELQGVASQGVQTFVPQSTNAGNVFEALGNTLGDAAVIDAENSIPAVEASLSTARARSGYLESLRGSCSINDGPPPQTSDVCQFNSGPKAGWAQDFNGAEARPAIVGQPCTDGAGSDGVGAPNRPRVASLTCRFFTGPRAGQTQDFNSIPGAVPTIVGGGCQDGQGSEGLGVPDQRHKPAHKRKH